MSKEKKREMENINRKDKENKESFFSLKSIKRKLGWAFGIIVLMVVVMTYFSYHFNVAVWTDSQYVKNVNAPLNVMIEEVIGYDAMLTANVEAALLHSMKGETAGVAEHKTWYDKQGVLLDNLLKIKAPALIAQSRRSAEEKELVYGYLKQLDETNIKLVDLETRAFTAMEGGNNDEASSLIIGETYQGYKTILRDLYYKWFGEEAKIQEYYQGRALANNIKVRMINGSLGIFFLLIAMIIPVLIFKTIVKPINKLTKVAEGISSGDLDVKVPEDLKKNKSEIGELARAFDRLLESSHFALKTFVESRIGKKHKEK